MAIYLPFLSTDRWQRQDNAPALQNAGDAPSATVTSQGQTLRVVHVNALAHDLRIRPWQTLAEAKAIAPHLTIWHDDPVADRRRLEELAVWADRFSPIVHIEGSDTLIIDATGCERLFRGEGRFVEQAVDGVCAQGFTVRAALADTIGASWALAHAHLESAVITEPGRDAEYLAPLPIRSLRIGSKAQAALASVGVETVASLLYLPRSSLVSRFGRNVLDRIDQALGHLPEPLIPYRPARALTSRVHLGSPTTRIDVLSEAIRQALGLFCEKLERRVSGVRQMFVTFYCPDVVTDEGVQTRTVTLPVDLSCPTRSVEHLHDLLIVLLDRLNLPAPADALLLWARELDPLGGSQEELFATESADAHELGLLFDRLSVRLGAGAVVTPELLSEHQPEKAFRYMSVVGAGKNGKCRVANGEAGVPSTASTRGARPLRLVSNPIEVGATALVPEGPPVAFQFQGARHTVAGSVGPERIETGWWRGPHIRRDYYRVVTESGRRFWLFRDRDAGRWFLHGWFD